MTQWPIAIEGGPSFEMAADEDSLLRGALRAGVALPYECSVGGCGACRIEWLAGPVETLWEDAPGLSARERKRGKRLACQTRPLGPGRVRVRLDTAAQAAAQAAGAVPPQRWSATLHARRALTPDMTEFSFALEAPSPPRFLPGQYALLYLPGVNGARAYSMSTAQAPSPQSPQAPDSAQDPLWHFIVRRTPSGHGSHTLFDAVPLGGHVTLDGPYGHAYLRTNARDVVCIAGGSGLGPMLSVARGVLADPQAPARQVHFFLGLRSQAELGAMAEVQRLVGPRLHLWTCLSSPELDSADTPAWTGATGFVHHEVAARLPLPLDAFEFYFAGPPPMVEAVQTLLMVEHRVPFEQVHFDRFV